MIFIGQLLTSLKYQILLKAHFYISSLSFASGLRAVGLSIDLSNGRHFKMPFSRATVALVTLLTWKWRCRSFHLNEGPYLCLSANWAYRGW